ncbi:MAG: hypothetical protein WCH62_03250 [Candidatus Omnitrophota bacterium]
MSCCLRFFFVIVVLTLSSCAGLEQVQPHLNTLMTQQQYDEALQLINKDQAAYYGPKNELLFLLDRGLLLHLAQRYKESIQDFEKAKRLYDDLYGHTFSEVAGSVLVNDYWKSYRGEDYEYVLVNVFQALNYASLDNLEEALADVRNIDNQLKLINARYNKNQKNVYRDDAFARLLGGALYEAQKNNEGLNDAYISNTKALNVYESEYTKNYGQSVPLVLKQNLLTTANFMGSKESNEYRRKFTDVKVLLPQEKLQKAEVYLIEYTGFSPVKVADDIVVPVDLTHIVRLSFAKFVDRPSQVNSSLLAASSIKGVEIISPTQVAEDIGNIAKKVLENRRGLLAAEALLRPMGKYVIEKVAEESLRANHNDTGAAIVNILGDIYNIVSERADLRSWQTLPKEIRIARLLLDPGQYTLMVRDYNQMNMLVEEKNLGNVQLKAGQKKFVVSRCYR